jgi:hypothetical protein
VLSPGELEGVQLLPLERGLFVGPPTHLWLEPPPCGGARALLGPKLPSRLRELLFDLRPREIAADGGVRDAVVSRKLAERLAGRAAADQLRVGN